MEENTSVYDRHGKLMCQLYKKKRTVVSLAHISKNLVHAILAIEDRNFYRHPGYDVAGILRASWANLRAGRIEQGGSTLTQGQEFLAHVCSESGLLAGPECEGRTEFFTQLNVPASICAGHDFPFSEDQNISADQTGGALKTEDEKAREIQESRELAGTLKDSKGRVWPLFRADLEGGRK